MHIQHRASLQKRSAMSVPRVITKRPRTVYLRSAVEDGQTKGRKKEKREGRTEGKRERGETCLPIIRERLSFSWIRFALMQKLLPVLSVFERNRGNEILYVSRR